MRHTLALTVLAPFLAGATCEYQTDPRPVGAATDVQVAPDAVDDTGDDGATDAIADASGDIDGCDLSGVWGIRQVAFNQDTILGAVQTASEWYIVSFIDTGAVIEATSSWSCGVEVSGSASVFQDAAALDTVVASNPWDGRNGRFELDDGTCAFELDPHYLVLGAQRDRYVPDGDGFPALEDLQASVPLPTMDAPEGADDWDGDGIPGIAYRVTGAVNGRRNVVQRYWYRYFSAPTYRIEPSATSFVARAELATEESLIAVDGCDPLCGLLATDSIVAPGYEHRVFFERLGDDPADAALRGDVIVPDDPVESCFRLREAMPHDPDAPQIGGTE